MVRAAEAADERNDLDDGGFAQRGVNELPPLLDSRERRRLTGRGNTDPERTVLRAILEDSVHNGLVGEPEHVVEIPLCVLRETSGMRPAECGDSSPRAEVGAERVGEV